MLDPQTWTARNEYDLSGHIVRYGWQWIEGYGPDPYIEARRQSGIEVGKQKSNDYFYLYRGYVSFYTAPIDDNAILVSANLSMFLSWSRCEADPGCYPVGFEVEFYSGKNQWTELTTSCWSMCTSYQGRFVWIYPGGMERKYYWQYVIKDSIAYKGGEQRTQFRFNNYVDNLYRPEGERKVQRCGFDNPMVGYGNPPRLEVIYHY